MPRGARTSNQRQVRFGTAELMRDLDRPNSWLLSVDGVAQSHVDLDDPTYLDFDYVRRIGDVIDCLPDGPLRALHIGGGACTLPRYIAARRPGSSQLVFDVDAELIEFVRERLDLRGVPRLRVRITDGRTGVASRPDASADLVVLDAFERAAMPGGLATLEFTRDVARVLRPGGTYVVNISDGPGLRFARRVVATAAEVFDSVLLLADPGVLRGRRFGNLVLAASAAELPVAELTRRAASAVFRARLVTGADLRSLVGRAEPITDAAPAAAPTPPDSAFT
ncbi:spermidine synthase [Goodfellowiella coeruleoviolacea]|uniref:Methyltransferase domain-containing protein n=1 Tax=Goodfellowiella coeruleoviolacea TaxID=334858 RepID=A0AAE3GAQ3_9PSEU|nr:fused MFS/spermidine synthase [Goodfellowiella coeruleoviolacea]MCP2164822.1 Methyltransferase domain-containing protein [Goodfellowiella coeruleoviolacea]